MSSFEVESDSLEGAVIIDQEKVVIVEAKTCDHGQLWFKVRHAVLAIAVLSIEVGEELPEKVQLRLGVEVGLLGGLELGLFLLLRRGYVLGGEYGGKDVDYVGIAGADEPVASSVETKRVDLAVFVTPPHFLQHLPSFSVEQSNIHPFFTTGGYFISIEGDCDVAEF